MEKTDKVLKFLNVLFVISFIIGPLLLAVSYFIGNEIGLGMTFTGLFILAGFLYWRYGVDFFDVNWLKQLKKDKA